MSFDWFGRLCSTLSLGTKTREAVQSKQRVLRESMSTIVFRAALLAVRNGGHDPAPFAVRLGDKMRSDFVGRMGDIADNVPFWNSVPERMLIRTGGILSPGMEEVRRDAYRARLRKLIERHDQLEKQRV